MYLCNLCNRSNTIYSFQQFERSDWLQKYINHTTKMRTMDRNDFAYDFYQLMIEFYFGTTMNVGDREHLDSISHTYVPAILRRLSKWSLGGIQTHYSNCNVVLFKEEQVFDNSIYLGCTVLKSSNLLMCKFYDKFQPYRCNKPTLQYMVIE